MNGTTEPLTRDQQIIQSQLLGHVANIREGLERYGAVKWRIEVQLNLMEKLLNELEGT